MAKDPLPIRSLEFLGGMAESGGWRPPADLPEIAFSGRSNVGKSTLLNRLVRRRSLARVSRSPGRTREINFFRVNSAFVLADLPGYGYARISKERQAAWRPLIESYLGRTPTLRGIVLLLDARHDPSDDDLAMLDYVSELGLPTLVAVTKIDKLSKKVAVERVHALVLALGLDETQVIPFSGVTGAGRDDLAAAVAGLVAGPSADPPPPPPAPPALLPIAGAR
jgi:GTP-binding protein